MKKTIVGVFAHPDDEAFGPGGTIAKLSKDHDIYILCATKGEAGQNHSENQNDHISKIREKELQEASKILGIKETRFLGFEDGTLSNNLYHKLAAAVTKELEKLKPDTIITFEPRGISGHIDHITVSMVATYVFYELSFIKELHYYCLSEEQRAHFTDKYFIYRPPGYKKSDIDLTVDVSAEWEVKHKAIYSHMSQIRDIEKIVSRMKYMPKHENFIVLKK
jgi:LmbE family N-acetylglucosaminyl deacetylase